MIFPGIVTKEIIKNRWFGDFPGGTADENLPANAGDMDSIPGSRRILHAM